MVLSCGGHVGWEGEVSPFSRDHPCITHVVVDRPHEAGRATELATCSYVQPQWLFDCMNARTLLPTHAYRPGIVCPPHLSPFGDGKEGYTPATVSWRESDALGAEAMQADEDEGDEGESDAEEEEEGAVDEDESEVGGEEDEEAEQYKYELASELTGGASRAKRTKTSARQSTTVQDEEKVCPRALARVPA